MAQDSQQSGLGALKGDECKGLPVFISVQVWGKEGSACRACVGRQIDWEVSVITLVSSLLRTGHMVVHGRLLEELGHQGERHVVPTART